MSKNPPPYPDIGFTPASNYQPPPQNYQQPNYGQQGPPPAPTVIITTNSPVAVGPNQARLICPSCRVDIVTDVKHEANGRTHCWALCLCLFICWPCVCVPYCMDSCRTTTHYCPNCNSYIGKYDP